MCPNPCLGTRGGGGGGGVAKRVKNKKNLGILNDNNSLEVFILFQARDTQIYLILIRNSISTTIFCSHIHIKSKKSQLLGVAPSVYVMDMGWWAVPYFQQWIEVVLGPKC